jgi:hypothetical protein
MTISGSDLAAHGLEEVAAQPFPIGRLAERCFCEPPALIPEIDIWRAAQLMLKRYGGNALGESAARANELALAGDDDGAATWRRIMAAVEQLANTTPPGRVN